ncbi:MAG: response regulator [Bacteroidia bacterium]
MANLTRRFIIVDDDPQNNFLSRMILRKSLEEVEVKDFLVPEEALEYIKTEFDHKPGDESIALFLDINMPSMTGWEFLEEFKTFPESIKQQFNIYMLSSSIDPADIQRAKQHPLVVDFMEKPLRKARLIEMFG